MAKLLASEVLPVRISNRNEGQGRSWYATHNERKSLPKKLEKFKRKPFDKQVDVVVTRILGRRESKYDADAVLRGNVKQIMDSLVELGWFADDGPKYIRLVLGDQDDTRRHEGPAVEIRVYEAGAIKVEEDD